MKYISYRRNPKPKSLKNTSRINQILRRRLVLSIDSYHEGEETYFLKSFELKLVEKCPSPHCYLHLRQILKQDDVDPGSFDRIYMMQGREESVVVKQN